MIDATDRELWKRVVEAEKAFIKARMELFAKSKNIVGLVQKALHQPTERATALGVAKLLAASQQQQLFPDLLSLASVGHGLTGASRELILSLPRQWVLSNIEAATKPILEQGGYEEYQRLLELFTELDSGLALHLAERAVAHPADDVQDAGREFLQRLRTRE